MEAVEDTSTGEALEADGESGIVETWLIGQRPAVREQRVIRAPRRSHGHARTEQALDISSMSPAVAAMQLAALPNASIVRHLSGLSVEARRSILEFFPLPRQQELAALLDDDYLATPDSPAAVPAALHLTGSSSSSGGNDGFPFWAKETAAKTKEWGKEALGAAGTAAERARQGLSHASDMAPELGGRVAGAASSAGTKARQVVEKAASSKSAERALVAAGSAASMARQGMAQGVASSMVAAGAAKQSLSQLANNSTVASEAKQRAAGAADAAKAGLSKMSNGVAGLLRKR